jgi:CheY-like chemotaxis protein
MARILISESHQDVRRLLERMLTRLGHEPVRVRVPDTEQLMSADVVIVEPSDPIGVVLSQAASIARPSLPLICASVTEPPTELTELGVIFSACLIKPFTTKQLEAAIEEALHSATPTEPVEEPTTIWRRALLVDDDQDVRAAVCTSLERTGDWSVTPVESGEAALDSAATAGPFDAVLLDVTMPGLGGPATLEGLRECGLPEEVPVIFLTTDAENRERQALIFLGGVGVIAKPIDSLALPGEIERLLSSPA